MIYRQTSKNTRVAIRNTTGADIDEIMALEQSAPNAPYVNHWSQDQHVAATRDPNIAHWVLEAGNDGTHSLLGYVILVGLQNPDDALHFRRIVVAEKGLGLGRLAVQYVKQFAFLENGCHRLWLNVKEGNRAAYSLYASEGFIEEGWAREAAKVAEGRYASHIVMSMLKTEYQEPIATNKGGN